MSDLSSYKLTHPDELSEHQLCEILKNSCIEIFDFSKLCKSELLEMYKRVAMPLPQRHRGGAKNVNAEVAIQEPVTIIKNNDIHTSNIILDKGNKRMWQPSDRLIAPTETNRLVAPISDHWPMSKKIRLYSPKIETACNGVIKRKYDESKEESLTKKRQKITWP